MYAQAAKIMTDVAKSAKAKNNQDLFNTAKAYADEYLRRVLLSIGKGPEGFSRFII